MRPMDRLRLKRKEDGMKFIRGEFNDKFGKFQHCLAVFGLFLAAFMYLLLVWGFIFHPP